MKKGNIRKRPCIFCARKNLTKEHVFGDWVRQMFPDLQPSHTTLIQRGVAMPSGETVVFPGKEIQRDGDPLSRRPRVVCKGCNTGWMGTIQNRTKPILAPLIRGESRELSVDDQHTLATWLTMVTFTSEFLTPETAMIPSEERERFFWSHEPFPGWLIMVGMYEPPQQGTWLNKRSARLGLKSHVLGGSYRENVQATAISIGNFFAYTFSVYIPFTEVPLQFPARILSKFFEIHPTPDLSPLRLDMANALAPSEVGEIVGTLANSYPSRNTRLLR